MLEKRVKRLVKARAHEFFAVTAPGLEDVCEAEIRRLGLFDVRPRAVPGGVVFSAKLPDLYAASLSLKTATRILMRVDSFTARDFATLEKKAAEIPWELYLPPAGKIRFRVSSHSSRLYHKDAVAERIYWSICERMEGCAVTLAEGGGFSGDAQAVQEVFARVHEDMVTVSLDSSGELLHRRGCGGLSAKAPLRETLAAAILILAGYDGSAPLFDPLCGSGNFASEAAFIAKNAPCGANRDFAFFRWPAFSAPTFEHLKKTAVEKIIALKKPSIFASDVDQDSLSALSARLSELNLADAVSVSRRDFFTLDPKSLTGEKGIVVLNPPYGKRLGTEKAARSFLADAAEKLKKDWAGFRLGLITPHEDVLGKIPWMKNLSRRRLSNGGLSVTLFYGEIPEKSRTLREVRFEH